MTNYTAERVFSYPREYIFDIVADVESYPDFLPFWQRAHVQTRDGDVYYTDQEIWMGILQERFRTKTILNYPTTIQVIFNEGSFQGLSILWNFEPTSEGQCRIGYTQSWKYRSFLKQQLLSLLFAENSRTVMNAFEKRAHELYSIDGMQDAASVVHR